MQVEFIREPIWVQMHHFPFSMMNKPYGEELGKRTSKVIEVDVDQNRLG